MLTLLFWLVATPVHADITACFPIESLSPSLQAAARRMLLLAMDREALYTLASDLKPWSGGIDVEPSLGRKDLERVTQTLRCGDDLEAGIQQYAIQDSPAEVYLLRRSSLGRLIRRHGDFFASLGITSPRAPATELLRAVERAPRYDRFRAYGLWFGYPEAAVDFYVDSARTEDESGRFVDREFVQVPTYESPTGRFVWAVPTGHTESAEERRIIREATRILSDYRERRQRWIQDEDTAPRSVELAREWLLAR